MEGIDYPDNLEIQMCTMAAGLMRQSSHRKLIEDALRAWSEAVDGPIQSWEYPHRIADWTHAPVQYPHLIQDYYSTNRKILTGSFLNGGRSLSEWSTTAPTLYCWLKILWNPDVDVDAIMDRMCTRLFGKAAGTSRQLLQLMCNRWEKAGWGRAVHDAGRIPVAVFTDTWPPHVVEEMNSLRKKARNEIENDPVALQRFEYWTWTFDAFLKEAENVWADSRY